MIKYIFIGLVILYINFLTNQLNKIKNVEYIKPQQYKESLIKLTLSNDIEIINDLAMEIFNNAIFDINKGHKNYVWYDDKYILDHEKMQLLLAVLQNTMKGVNIISEYKNNKYLINIDWSKTIKIDYMK
jgi:hypothetical protein